MQYGFRIITPTRVISIEVRLAIDAYGKEEVAKIITPLFPALVEKTGDKYKKEYEGDGGDGKHKLSLYEDFKEAYERGERIIVEDEIVIEKQKTESS